MPLFRSLLLVFLAALGVASPAAAQPWPTTDWLIVSEDGEPFSGPRSTGAVVYRQQLIDASRWYQAAGFRAPEVIREGADGDGPLGRYIGLMKSEETDLGAVYANERYNYSSDPLTWFIEHAADRSRTSRTFRLSQNTGAWDPQNPGEYLMSAGAVHELFHGVQAAYGGWVGAPAAKACHGEGRSTDWAWEGAASAVQIRWLERASGARYQHPYRDASRGAWVRYFDQSLHRPSHQVRDAPEGSYVYWQCGYGTWYFWYAAGEMLGRTPEQKIGYLQYVFGGSNDWSDYGVKNTDEGLRRAAAAYGTSARYDGGLYDVFPEFIAQYADDSRHYASPDAVYLRGGSEVLHREGGIEPLAAQAFEVRVNIPDAIPSGQSARVRVTLPSQAGRETLHLIEGQRVIRRPSAPEDPYEVEFAIRQDTTLLIRVANVAEDGPATGHARYQIRFEVGGFYGTSADASDIPGIPPGFTVVSGPPSLLGCHGTDGGGSVFDLITADEASGDIRRIPARGEAVGEDALRSMEAMGMDTSELRAQLREAVEQAENDPDLAEEQAETTRRFSGRSRLEANFVGQTATGKPCQIVLHATLNGEQGGFQTIDTAQEPDPNDENPVGINHVAFMAGSMQDMIGEPFEICTMTEEEQRDAARGRCPRVCSVGSLALERARQGHAQGLFRASVFVEDYDDMDAQGCPATQVLPFVFSFNITSANSGQDGEVVRSTSDEMLRLLGATEREIDELREVD